MDAARRLQTYLSGKHRKMAQVKRRKTFEKYIPEIARALSILTGEPEEKIREYFITYVENHFAAKETKIGEVSENA